MTQDRLRESFYLLMRFKNRLPKRVAPVFGSSVAACFACCWPCTLGVWTPSPVFAFVLSTRCALQMLNGGRAAAWQEAERESCRTPARRSALRELGADGASPNEAVPVVEVTPRVRRGVDWASAAERVDRFVSALQEAEAQAESGNVGCPYVLRSTWSVPVRADAPDASDDARPEAPTLREEALQRRLDEAESSVSRLQLALALSEMRDATQGLDCGRARAHGGGGEGTPGSAQREQLRAERAEANREEAERERDAAQARCVALEEALATAGELCALLRRRAEEAETRHLHAPPSPALPQPSAAVALLLQRLREEVRCAVHSAEALPRDARRQRLRALRLKWHPDKHLELRGLATAVTQLLNAEIAELKLRLALDDDDV